MKNHATPTTIHLKDYQRPHYGITRADLTFDLHDTRTRVRSKLRIQRLQRPDDGPSNAAPPLVLNGEKLKLIRLLIDGRELAQGEYRIGEETLAIEQVPAEFTLESEVEIDPSANKSLNGLYKSGNMFCTQNEPEGMRRITYFIDRPDVMAIYTTEIIADKALYPVLLSNGNPVAEGDLEDGRHWAKWSDPFSKPCYLFALVAGNLDLLQDHYTTLSGRKIDCRIYCDKGNVPRCHHAMRSLKKAMRWDEETFGLECDLDIYMIVVVDSFNMGAMENKGLNIFNSSCVLADEKTSTDDDLLQIESIVGHEYFHNWTGNRVTCRDWFQLTLKEGLTVFRDQEFSSELNSRAVQRIHDIARLKSAQFSEDAGPMAHPIQPQQYMEINNFYTATVYEKGAEVIRMIHTFLGGEGFRRGIDRYFELFDGQAVTTDDFLRAMSEANGDYDFTQFKCWYFQAGTPEIKVTGQYDEKEQTFSLKVEQSCPPTPGQKDKKPFHFPLNFGLLGPGGKEIPVDDNILHIKKKQQTFTFEGIKERPILSINRGLSAPAKTDLGHIDPRSKSRVEYSDTDLATLWQHDSDPYNRYEAGQTLALQAIENKIQEYEFNLKAQKEGFSFELPATGLAYILAYGDLLEDTSLDPALKAISLSVPRENIVHQHHDPVDFDIIHRVRDGLIVSLAKIHRPLFLQIYRDNATEGQGHSLDPASVGKRSLRNLCLHYLASLAYDHKAGKEDAEILALCREHFERAKNMTDEWAALQALQQWDTSTRREISQAFFEKWRDNNLVMQKWLSSEANSPIDGALERVQNLERLEIYDTTVPNLVRSVWGGFVRNYIHFHHPSGWGYQMVADKIIEIDRFNPQMASSLAGSFRLYKKLLPGQKKSAQNQLTRIRNTQELSKNTYEIVTKTLDDGKMA